MICIYSLGSPHPNWIKRSLGYISNGFPSTKSTPFCHHLIVVTDGQIDHAGWTNRVDAMGALTQIASNESQMEKMTFEKKITIVAER